MQIKIISSGSGGNSALVRSNGVNLLIDAGISCRRIEQALKGEGIGITELSGILISHEHTDHVSGLKTLCKKYSVPVFCSGPVAERLNLSCGVPQESLKRFRGSFRLDGLNIIPFEVPHDSVTCHGFRIEGDSVYASATDMGHYTDEIIEHLSGADIAMIEANHDINMLYSGPYPYYLKKRILSNNGHLSNIDCARLISMLSACRSTQFVLGHLSKTNNTPQAAFRTVIEHDGNKDIRLLCASETAALDLHN